MSNKTWKNAERRIADIIGGERVPVTGRQRGSAPDIAHPIWSIEVKHRAKLPDWLHDAMAQAVASNKGGQLPIVILHEENQPYAKSFVVVELGEFQNWYGDIPQPLCPTTESNDDREAETAA